jgi:hypothetical protein
VPGRRVGGGRLGRRTEGEVRALCERLKEAQGAEDAAVQEASDRGVVARAAQVEAHMRAMLAAARSLQPAGQHQAHVTAVGRRCA